MVPIYGPRLSMRRHRRLGALARRLSRDPDRGGRSNVWVHKKIWQESGQNGGPAQHLDGSTVDLRSPPMPNQRPIAKP